MLRKSLALLTCSVLFAAGGCGGGAPLEGVGTRLNLIPSEGYNGATSPIEVDSATTTVQNGHVVATITSGVRTLRIEIPTSEIHPGDEFDIGLDGTTVTYTEARGSIAAYAWNGVSGKVTVSESGLGTQALVSVQGANFVADLTVQGNAAGGAFTLDGSVSGIPVSASGGIGGQATLTFSTQQPTNADLSSFSHATMVYVQADSAGTLSATTGDQGFQRVLSVILTPSAQVGDVIDLSNMQNGKGTATFSQGTTTNARVWAARAGTLTVLSRTDTSARVLFRQALFTGSAGGASGAFTVDGTLARR